MGRLFDAVSSIIDIRDYNTFEGEAAMYLQVCAEEFVRKNGLIGNTFITLDSSVGQCVNELMIGVNAKIDKGKLAYDFLNWLVNQVRTQAFEANVDKIAFSGGVFQNSLLLYMLKKNLDSEFELYFHKQLSPNDESISFGQLAYEYFEIKSLSKPKLLEPETQELSFN
jgi:hydrogenase maturation protein HypF